LRIDIGAVCPNANVPDNITTAHPAAATPA